MSDSFKNKKTFEQRSQEAQQQRQKHPDRVPIIVERHENSQNVPAIRRKKFLAPQDLTIGQFLYTIRKEIQLASDQALFLFVDNQLPAAGQMLKQVDNQYRDKDGFLYMVYSGESTFGYTYS